MWNTRIFMLEAPVLVLIMTMKHYTNAIELIPSSEFHYTDVSKRGPGSDFCCWDISRIGNAALINFSDEFSNREILMAYNISKGRHAVASLSEYSDCSTPLSNNNTDDQAALNITKYERLPLTSDHEGLFVYMDVIQNQLANSSIFSFNETSGFAYLEFCTRLDLIIDHDLTGDGKNDSISYLETRLKITVDMTQSFGGLTLASDSTAIAAQEQFTDIQYNVDCCICNSKQQCITTPFSQNSEILICVKNYNSPVKLVDIITMSFEQVQDIGDISLGIIKDSQPSAPFTSFEVSSDGRISVISTRLVSTFFSDTLAPISVTGILLFEFEAQRNLLRRNIQENDIANEALASFSTTILLEKQNVEVTSAGSSPMMMVANSLLLMIFSFALL